MTRLGISLVVVWLVGCGESPSRPTPPTPPGSSANVEPAPDPRKLLLGDGVPRDRERALALYNETCHRGDAASCRVVVDAAGVDSDLRTAAAAVLWRRCQTGEMTRCRLGLRG